MANGYGEVRWPRQSPVGPTEALKAFQGPTPLTCPNGRLWPPPPGCSSSPCTVSEEPTKAQLQSASRRFAWGPTHGRAGPVARCSEGLLPRPAGGSQEPDLLRVSPATWACGLGICKRVPSSHLPAGTEPGNRVSMGAAPRGGVGPRARLQQPAGLHCRPQRPPSRPNGVLGHCVGRVGCGGSGTKFQSTDRCV